MTSLIFTTKFLSKLSHPVSVVRIQMLYVDCVGKSKTSAEFKLLHATIKLASSVHGTAHVNEYVCTSHTSTSVVERVHKVVPIGRPSFIELLERVISVGALFTV